ncbi:MAG: SDR family oxidoreductase [Bacteroidales bacterium]|nr:SDR family oxidoreductase [Bacteroidales bacterium]
MAYNFKGKVVVVTGASSGIGLAISREFASAGSRVAIVARSGNRLAELADEINSNGGEAFAIVTDVTDEMQCQSMVEKCIERFGRLDILINNAGISMRASFADSDINVLRRVMEVNFWGTVNCTKYALPHLIANRGVLVGISSVAGFHGLPGRTGYSASKFAMHGFLETIRIENFFSGMHVMILAPGFTASNIRYHALTADGSEQGETPRKEDKMVQPEYVARWVLKGIRKKKRNKILTWNGRFIAFFQRIIPWIVDWTIFRLMDSEPGSPLKK